MSRIVLAAAVKVSPTVPVMVGMPVAAGDVDGDVAGCVGQQANRVGARRQRSGLGAGGAKGGYEPAAA